MNAPSTSPRWWRTVRGEALAFPFPPDDIASVELPFTAYDVVDLLESADPADELAANIFEARHVPR
jgi:hypothetical protein